MQSLLTFICLLQVGAICVQYSCALKKKMLLYLGLLQLHDYPSHANSNNAEIVYNYLVGG